MEAKMCNYTHLVYKITHLRCARYITHHWVCKTTHLCITHLVLIKDVLLYTLLGKNTPLLITPISTLHLSHFYTPFGYIHISQFYTPFEYTRLPQFYTPFEDTHLSMLHTFRPKNSILHGNIFLRCIKSIKSVYLGVQPCRRVYGVHI